MIVGAVILSGVLPMKFPAFAKGINFCEGVTLSWAAIIEIVIMQMCIRDSRKLLRLVHELEH